MDLKGSNVVVAGGSRGLGAGVVDALVGRGARVTVISRSANAGEAGRHPAVEHVEGDATDAALAREIVAVRNPHAVVLNAGAVPPTTPIDVIDWAEFSAPWETDVRAALAWTQASIAAPMRPGGIVLSVSSGAAVNGSPLSGGYAGAKRVLWLMANYADALAAERDLELTFQTVAPMQMVAGTGVGDAAATAYARRMETDPATFLARFGSPLTPASFGGHVADILGDADRAVRAYGVGGDAGRTVLEKRAG